MTSRYDPMTSVMKPKRDNCDVAGIPFPAENCVAKLEFPPILHSDSFLGEVLAFIRSEAAQTAGDA